MRPTYIERYHAMLAGRGMKVGSQVVCTFRTPAPNQWWTSPWPVGVIEEPSNDGHNSEASYCANYLYVKVRYLGRNGSGGFTQRDPLASLLPLLGEPVAESPYFCSDPAEAIRLFQFACLCGLGERYVQANDTAWDELKYGKERI